MVIYERFQYKALTENIFGVLELGVVAYGRWSPTGGGHLREVVARGGSTVLCFRFGQERIKGTEKASPIQTLFDR